MRGREFVLGLPRHGTDPERDEAIVKAVSAGHHAPLNWARIQIRYQGRVASVFVMRDAVMVGEPGDYCRVSMNADTAQRVAWALGGYLPTTKICDAIWDAAEVRVPPCTQGPPKYSYDDMDKPSRMVDYHNAVDKEIIARGSLGNLIGNVGKDWVLTNKNLGSDRVRNYGWYVSSGWSVSASGYRMIQTLGAAHNSRHVDYSQMVRLVKNEIEVEGNLLTFAEVALSPDLAWVVSSEGILKNLYIPSAEKWKPADGQAYELTPLPDEVLSSADSSAVIAWMRGEGPKPDIPLVGWSGRTLYKGVTPGDDVGEWQRFVGVKDDNKFGPITHGATQEFQRAHGLEPNGIVDAKVYEKMREVLAEQQEEQVRALPPIKFVQAKNYTWANRKPGDVKWIVIHSMESSEKPTVAEAVASWFAGPDAPRASAHYNIDNDSIVQSVKCEHVAWHAPGANKFGIGLEHAGRARQTEQDWFDDYSLPMLRLSARLCASLCRQWGIPPVFVGRDGLKAGAPGITTHHEVSQAFKKSDHWDPGAGFPMAWYLDRVQEALEE